jgi:hypothetical protein
MLADARPSVRRQGSIDGADLRSADICDRRNYAMFRTRIGPAISLKLSRPSDQGGTRGARLGSITTSPIVTFNSKYQLPPIHKTRCVKGIQDSSPQYCQRISGSFYQGGTCGTRSSSVTASPIATSKQIFSVVGILEMRSVEGV